MPTVLSTGTNKEGRITKSWSKIPRDKGMSKVINFTLFIQYKVLVFYLSMIDFFKGYIINLRTPRPLSLMKPTCIKLQVENCLNWLPLGKVN